MLASGPEARTKLSEISLSSIAREEVIVDHRAHSLARPALDAGPGTSIARQRPGEIAVGALEMARHVALIGEARAQRGIGDRVAGADHGFRAIEAAHRQIAIGLVPSRARKCRASA